MTEPNASASIDVAAPPLQVYALVSDPSALADCAEEYDGHQWLGGATAPAKGARFRGRNRLGARRWSTVSTITDADEGRRFAFDVSSIGLSISRWQYDIEPAGDGVRLTESTWDRRPGWLRAITGLVTGVRHRDPHNRANIETTLRRIKDTAERA
ncbi:SRPBCC family protein [Amycolatopsis minnesotensis]|uniref:SRPBCC family protein n=1 Tax=Amycolatopsis minnesotensis TaxID=337894 RepID=A0ABN2RGC7_9PSEU